MLKYTFQIFTAFLWYFSRLSVLALGIEECCYQVYLFSGDILADDFPTMMGIYEYQGEHEDKPYFMKSMQYQLEDNTIVDENYYLMYADNGKHFICRSI